MADNAFKPGCLLTLFGSWMKVNFKDYVVEHASLLCATSDGCVRIPSFTAALDKSHSRRGKDVSGISEHKIARLKLLCINGSFDSVKL